MFISADVHISSVQGNRVMCTAQAVCVVWCVCICFVRLSVHMCANCTMLCNYVICPFTRTACQVTMRQTKKQHSKMSMIYEQVHCAKECVYLRCVLRVYMCAHVCACVHACVCVCAFLTFTRTTCQVALKQTTKSVFCEQVHCA